MSGLFWEQEKQVNIFQYIDKHITGVCMRAGYVQGGPDPREKIGSLFSGGGGGILASLTFSLQPYNNKNCYTRKKFEKFIP